MSFDLEKEIIQLFIDKKRRERLLSFIDPSKNQRNKFFDQLRDTRYFDSSCLLEVKGKEKQEQNLFLYLQSLGIKEKIYLICSNPDLDQKQFPFDLSFLKKFLALEEGISYCVTSKTGIFKNHEDSIFILKH